MIDSFRHLKDNKCVPLALVLEKTERAPKKIVADGTGMADFANMAVGGAVVSQRAVVTCVVNKTDKSDTFCVLWFGGGSPLHYVFSQF